jgi:4'-phosphopantetheinyl transferase
MITAPALPPPAAHGEVLAAGEVHLWWMVLSPRQGAVTAAWATASAAERQRAQCLRVPQEREHYLLRHQALRQVLAGYAGATPHALVFENGPFGKPALTAPPGATGLSFNLSRSGSVAVLAVAGGGRVGVDVERLRPFAEADAVARRMFSAAESKALAALPDPARLAGFYRLWTCKEAVVKALGGGLAIALDGFDVDPRVDQPPALQGWRLPGYPPTLRLLPVPQLPGHAIALAADAPIDRCRLRPWPGVVAAAVGSLACHAPPSR